MRTREGVCDIKGVVADRDAPERFPDSIDEFPGSARIVLTSSRNLCEGGVKAAHIRGGVGETPEELHEERRSGVIEECCNLHCTPC